MGAIQTKLQSDRTAVFKAKQDIIEQGNMLVSVINMDKLFHDDICSRLAYTYAEKLKGFSNETLEGVSTSIGLEIPYKPTQSKQREELCKKIVEFFMLKVDIISEAFADIGYCERIEEEIFRGISMKQICPKKSDKDDLKCCSDGTWKKITEECSEGFENKTKASSVLNELRSFNKKINSSYKRIKSAVQDVINSETISQLRSSQIKLESSIKDSKNICYGEWNIMSKYQDSNSSWLPEEYIRVRRYDYTSKDVNVQGFNLKKGTIVEIIKVGNAEVLVRIPAYCQDETKCLTSVPTDALTKNYEPSEQEKVEQIIENLDDDSFELYTEASKSLQNISQLDDISDEEIQDLKNVLSGLPDSEMEEPGTEETDNFDV